MDKYAETKEILNAMADVKMKMNSHKGNIEDICVGDIVKMIQDEVTELIGALDKGTLMDVFEEIADVQNFLVAIAHQRIAKYRGRK